jgi:hypothetical protein
MGQYACVDDLTHGVSLMTVLFFTLLQLFHAVALHPLLVKPLKEGQNFIGMLDSVCQTLRWEKPEDEFTESESGFECECRLSAQSVLVTGTGVAIKKQKAKNIAAGRVLEQLQAIAKQ